MIPFSDSDVRHRSFPIVNVLLIGVNVLVFLYELQLGGLGLLRGGGDLDIVSFFAKWGFIPNELTQGVACTHQVLGFERCPQLPAEFLARPEANLPVFNLPGGFILLNIDTPLPTWTTIFSSMFIHAGFFHFAGNMMFLWVFGDNVEDWLGHFKYLVFYLLAGIAATLSQLAIDPNSLTPMIGASGAISGVMGAYMLLYPFNRINTLIIFFFLTVMRLPAVGLLGLWFPLAAYPRSRFTGDIERGERGFLCPCGGLRCGSDHGRRSQAGDRSAGLAVAPGASTVGLLVPNQARTGLVFSGAGRVTLFNPRRRSPFIHYLNVGAPVAP